MKSISRKVADSAGFLLAAQLVQRSLGLVSTLILARLLTPEHFGVVALVAIALQFFDILADAGNQHYIIQKPDLDEADLHTAWTLDVLIKSTVFAGVCLATPALATYFATPELRAALPVAALALPLRALRNPMLMRWARELNYRPGFILALWSKVVSFVVVVGWALLQPSYWALIAGSLVSVLVLVVGSYRLTDFRPRVSLGRVREQWAFSQWVILRGLTGFTRSQIDNLVVSRLFTTGELGGYHLVRELATFPAVSVIIPGSEPLQSAIAESQQRAEDLAYRLRLSQFMMIGLLTPITAYMMVDAELIVAVLLGDQWAEFGGLLRPFGLYFFTFCLFALVSDAFMALGRVRALFLFDLVSTGLILAILFSLPNPDLMLLAWVRGLLAVATTLALMVQLNLSTRFGLWHTFWLAAPVFAATAAGLAVLYGVSPYTARLAWPLATLLINGAAFSAVTGLAGLGLLTALQQKTPEYQHLLQPLLSRLYKWR